MKKKQLRPRKKRTFKKAWFFTGIILCLLFVITYFQLYENFSVFDSSSVTWKDSQIVNEATINPPANFEKGDEYNIVIDKSEYELQLFQNGILARKYPIAVGKNSGDKLRAGDMRTPIGTFRIDEIIDSKSWVHDFEDGKGEIDGAYGPWFISLKTKWDGIGIHGTHDLSSIGTKASEGCIRMRNDDLEEVKKMIAIGHIVEIRE